MESTNAGRRFTTEEKAKDAAPEDAHAPRVVRKVTSAAPVNRLEVVQEAVRFVEEKDGVERGVKTGILFKMTPEQIQNSLKQLTQDANRGRLPESTHNTSIYRSRGTNRGPARGAWPSRGGSFRGTSPQPGSRAPYASTSTSSATSFRPNNGGAAPRRFGPSDRPRGTGTGARTGTGGASNAPVSQWRKAEMEMEKAMGELTKEDNEDAEQVKGGTGKKRKRGTGLQGLWENINEEEEEEDAWRDNSTIAESIVEDVAVEEARRKAAKVEKRVKDYKYQFVRERLRKTAFVTAYRLRDRRQDLEMKVQKVEYKMVKATGNSQYRETGAVVQIYGYTRGYDPASVRLDVYGFRPYFFMEMPSGWTGHHLQEFLKRLDQDVWKSLEDRAKSGGSRLHQDFYSHNRSRPGLLLSGEVEQCVENKYRPDMIFNAVKIEVAYPGLVPEFRRRIEAMRHSYLTRGLPVPPQGFNNVTYESDMLFYYRFMCDVGVAGESFIRVPRGFLETVAVRDPGLEEKASLVCPVDYYGCCRFENIHRLTDDELAVEPTLPENEEDVIIVDADSRLGLLKLVADNATAASAKKRKKKKRRRKDTATTPPRSPSSPLVDGTTDDGEGTILTNDLTLKRQRLRGRDRSDDEMDESDVDSGSGSGSASESESVSEGEEKSKKKRRRKKRKKVPDPPTHKRKASESSDSEPTDCLKRARVIKSQKRSKSHNIENANKNNERDVRVDIESSSSATVPTPAFSPPQPPQPLDGWKGGETTWTTSEGKRRRLKWKVKVCPLTHKFVIPKGVDRSPKGKVTLSFDIEVKGKKGVFPESGKYPVTNIGVTLRSEEKPDDVALYCFVLRSLGSFQKKGQFVKVYSYESELELLLEFRRFALTTDPDILTGYNIDIFDWVYIHDRIQELAQRRPAPPCGNEPWDWETPKDVYGDKYEDYFPEDHWREVDRPFVDEVMDALMLSRDPEESLRCKEQVFSNRAVGKRANVDVLIAGRTDFDMIRYIVANKKLRSYALGDVGQEFLGMSKEEMPHEKIPDAFRTREGRKKLAFYCVRDAYIADRLMHALNAVLDQGEFAYMLNMNLDDQLKRGTTAKCKSLFADDGFRKELVELEDGEQRWFRCVTRTRTEEDRKSTQGTKYVGAHVFAALRGFHTDPVSTLDFASLYPSIMMDHNICYSVFGTPEEFLAAGLRPGTDFVEMSTRACYLRRSKRMGTIPKILEKLLAKRGVAKYKMSVFDKQKGSMGSILKGLEKSLKDDFEKAFPGETIGGTRWRSLMDAIAEAWKSGGETAVKAYLEERNLGFLHLGDLRDDAPHFRRMDLLRLELDDKIKVARVAYQQVTGEDEKGPRWTTMMKKISPKNPDGTPARISEDEVHRIVSETVQGVSAFDALLSRHFDLDTLYLVGSSTWKCEFAFAKLQASYYNAKQNAIKTMMNSLYGLLGFSGSFLYHMPSAATVTTEGQNMIKLVAITAISYFRLHTELLLRPGGNPDNKGDYLDFEKGTLRHGGDPRNRGDWFDFKECFVARNEQGDPMVHLPGLPESAPPVLKSSMQSIKYLDPGIFYKDKNAKGRDAWYAVRDVEAKFAASVDEKKKEFYRNVMKEAAEVRKIFLEEYPAFKASFQRKLDQELAVLADECRLREKEIKQDIRPEALVDLDPVEIAARQTKVTRRVEKTWKKYELDVKVRTKSLTKGHEEEKKKLLRCDRFQVCECDTEIIYGDTDSVFVKQHGMAGDMLAAMHLGRVMANFVTEKLFTGQYNRHISLAWEKTWWKIILYSKKKYCGVMWMLDKDDEPYVPNPKFSGIEVARRDNCRFVPNTMEKCLNIILQHEGSAQDAVNKAIDHVHQRILALRTNQIGWDELILSGGIKKSVGGAPMVNEDGTPGITPSEYPNPTMFSGLAREINKRKKCEYLKAGARFKAVVVKSEHKEMWRRVEEPIHAWENQIPLDVDWYTYYALGKPAKRMFYFLLPRLDPKNRRDLAELEEKIGEKLFQGPHMLKVVDQESKIHPSLLMYAQETHKCKLCSTIIPGRGEDPLCVSCRQPKKYAERLGKLKKDRADAEIEKTSLDMDCRDCVANLYDTPIDCVNDGCHRLWKQKAVTRRLRGLNTTLRALRDL